MDKLIARLAYERGIVAQYKQEITEIQTLIQERYGEMLEEAKSYLATAQADAQDTEAAIRKAALREFDQTGNKKPHAAVQVKTYATIGYDENDAFSYCVEHLTSALKMDKRKFEKVAKVAEPDFVDIGQEQRATIARDLSEYLED